MVNQRTLAPLGPLDNGARATTPVASARVVVVGAGLAGLAAADSLVNSFKFGSVTLLEAANQPGGRVKSVFDGGTNC